jgi:type IV pilus assembly protein PilY1
MNTAIKMRKLNWLIGMSALVALSGSGNSFAAPLALQDVPLFIAAGAEPNVMVMLDSSGSMENIVPDEPYNPATVYLGTCPAGNQPNPATRINLALTGTPAAPRINIGGNNFQWGTAGGRVCFVTGTNYLAMLNTLGGGFLPAQYTGNYLNWYFDTTKTVPGCTEAWAQGRKPCTKSRIIIARTAGVNLVNTMPSAMRAGLATYNGNNGGQLRDVVGDLTAAKRTALATAINGIAAAGNTPLAETLSDIGYYFSRGATGNLILHPNTTPVSVTRDTVFGLTSNGYTRHASWNNGSNPITSACQKSFAVLLTDGRPNDDQAMVAQLRDYDGDCAGATPACQTFDRKTTQQYEPLGSDYLDDVALALFEIDLRPDLSDASGSKNNVVTYLISFADDQAINDPLMQRAADQGGGEKFIAGNESELNAAFAAALSAIQAQSASASSASVNSSTLSSESRVFQAKFSSVGWTGQLFSYPIAADGSLITTSGDGPDPWEASDVLPAANSRNIITVNTTGVPVAFRWTGGTTVDATQKAQLGSEQMLNYLRGDVSNEGTGPTNYRRRQDAGGSNRLGDIVSSSPVFVGTPAFRYRDSLESGAYSAFVSSNTNRRQMVYVGANDGMLHGFDANTGVEVFGFIPSPVVSRLPNLASPSYSHEFYVDGSPTMGDVFFGGSWHTVLVGGLNKGGKGIYALDVTNPGSLAGAEGSPGSVVLWEFTEADDPSGDLGLTYSEPSIVKLQNGTWAAVFGNGYNSSTGIASLYVVDIATGNLIRKIRTSTTALTPPTGVTWNNGLSTPTLVDANGDRRTEAAYAGDLFGNMWKFDLSGADGASWGVAFSGSPLFRARDATNNAQPITVAPALGRGPKGAGIVVLFGTGKYLELADKQSTPQRTQTFYGIIDRGSAVANRSGLIQQSITQQTSTLDPDGAGPAESMRVRITSQNGLTTSSTGWYMDLLNPAGSDPGPAGYVGERQVTNPIVRDDRIVFTTLIPNTDPCGSGGTSWLMELDLLSGSSLSTAPFDINRDGLFNDADKSGATHISGVQFTNAGILWAPGILESRQRDGDDDGDGDGDGDGGGGGGGGGGGDGGPDGGICVQHFYMPDSAGSMTTITGSCPPGGLGRQSWRQIR